MDKKLKEIEMDRDFWRERYFEAIRKCEKLEEIIGKESKLLDQKPEIEENSLDVEHDPLKLPVKCVANILKYLSGEELLLAREISKNWKQKIEGNNMNMKRAMEEVVVNFDDFTMSGDIGSETPPKRAYENMRALFPQYSALSDGQLFPLIGHYASSLVDLDLECRLYCINGREKHDYNNMQPITFPALKKLSLYCKANGHTCDTFAQFILSSSFPILEEIVIYGQIFKGAAFSKLLIKFPKLEHVLLVGNMDATNFKADSEVIFPKVKNLAMSFHCPIIVEAFKESLTEVYFYCYLSTSDVDQILRAAPNLTLLMIGSFERHKDRNQLRVHKNLRSLQVKKCNRNDFQLLIAVFPNLQDLLLPSIDEATIHWLASNMIELKKLESYEITAEAGEAHARLGDDKERHPINTKFELFLLCLSKNR